MRVVRLRGPGGVEHGTVADGAVVTEGGTTVEPLDPATLELPPPYELLLPVEPPEVWCAGVTYERSRDARVEESRSDVYARVYEADRPELFLKDAACRRTVGPGGKLGVRADAAWNVPEPEIGLVLGERGAIAGYTIGNDVSSRDIEGANPLYLPQAKVYAGACGLGPAVLLPDGAPAAFSIRMRITGADGAVAFAGETSTARMRRTFEDLVAWLLRDNPVPPGSVLLTGTGLVPPDDFTLAPGSRVEIEVPEIGKLVHTVSLATELLERSR
jgi:2-dehydro-3-deoxy-D-arabinonate dehydratase